MSVASAFRDRLHGKPERTTARPPQTSQSCPGTGRRTVAADSRWRDQAGRQAAYRVGHHAGPGCQPHRGARGDLAAAGLGAGGNAARYRHLRAGHPQHHRTAHRPGNHRHVARSAGDSRIAHQPGSGVGRSGRAAPLARAAGGHARLSRSAEPERGPLQRRGGVGLPVPSADRRGHRQPLLHRHHESPGHYADSTQPGELGAPGP